MTVGAMNGAASSLVVVVCAWLMWSYLLCQLLLGVSEGKCCVLVFIFL